jgi:hypothetical protein
MVIMPSILDPGGQAYALTWAATAGEEPLPSHCS